MKMKQRNWIPVLALGIAMNLISGIAVAATDIKPYHADYIAKVYGQSGKASRSLTIGPDGHYTLEMNANAKFLGIIPVAVNESAKGSLKKGLEPSSYHYEMTGPKERIKAINFDRKKQLAISQKGDKPEEKVALQSKLFDPLSYQLQLRQDLEQGKKNLEYAVVDGDEIDHYQFKIENSNEKVATEAGDFSTIRVKRVRDNNDRVTEIWFAPKLNYLPVKLRQLERGTEYNILLSKYHFIKTAAPKQHSTETAQHHATEPAKNQSAK